MTLSLQHIHMVSHDKKKLAEWYCDHLGFVVTDDLETRGEPDGPILITADQNKTSISIFTRDRPIQNIFPAFEGELKQFLELHLQFGRPRIYDHYRFFSFYIRDPDQNKLEICITQYEEAQAEFRRQGIPFVYMTPDTYIP